ncbi:MAG: sugar phosphate isomerase/epimerase family protein [Saccharofermentanales bacterium]|jgi:sugar phosphate isomerase/epimerase
MKNTNQFKYALMSMVMVNEFKTKRPTFFSMIGARMQGFDKEGPVTHEDLAEFYAAKGQEYKPGTMTFEEFVILAKECGYDGVDMMATFLDTPGKEIREILDRHKMELSSISLISAFCAARTDEEMQAKLAEARYYIDMAAEAGAHYVLINAASIAAVPGISREASYQKMIFGLKTCVEYAKTKGVTLSTEALHTIQVPYCSIGEMKRIFAEIPELTYSHDTGNMLPVLEDPVEALEALKDRTVFVHMKDLEYADRPGAYDDVCGRKLALAVYGTGLVDFKAVMRSLKKMKYQGFITLESRSTNPTDFKQGLKDDLKLFKDMEASL